ncbi:MAG: hypothetical protein ACTSRR_09905 [Candidatus Heimdallarchaeaceae archaeon]
MADLRRKYGTLLDKQKILEIVFVTLISLFLFVLSLYVKDAFYSWYYEQKGIGFYWYYDPSNPEAVWFIEGYVDASYYYQPYLYAFRYQNWNPYMGGEGPLNGYAYGPLFIYGLYFISLFVSVANPSLSNFQVVIESVKWTHIVFDSLSVIMLFFITINLEIIKSKKFSKYFTGVIASVVYIFMPFNLLYIDALNLNIPQMTFFVLLGTFFFRKEKYVLSSFAMTLGWLSKQMPLFIVVPWFIILWKKDEDLKKALVDFLFPFFIFTLIFSIPWLILSPGGYLFRIFGPGKPLSFVSLSSKYNGYTVTLAHSFLKLGSETLANIYLFLNKYMIPFFVFYILTLLICYFNALDIFNDEKQFYIYTTVVVLVSHIFISRGIYKYYDAFFSPFFILFLVLLLWSYFDLCRFNNRTLFYSYFFVSIISSSIILYYINWVIIIKSRFLHPLYLLLIFIFVSSFLESNFYSSLSKFENYRMIILDIKKIYSDVKNSLRIHKKEKDPKINPNLE